MAKTFLSSDGDIRAVMTTMFTSEGIPVAREPITPKVKTPFEMIVSSIRATGAEVDYAFPLANRIAQLGQPLYRKLEPTGYSNANAEWINSASLLARMNFALDLTQNKVQGTKVDQARFNEDHLAHLARMMHCSPIPPRLTTPQSPSTKPSPKPSRRRKTQTGRHHRRRMVAGF